MLLPTVAQVHPPTDSYKADSDACRDRNPWSQRRVGGTEIEGKRNTSKQHPEILVQEPDLQQIMSYDQGTC